MLATVEAMAVDADVNVNAKNNMTGSTLLVCYTWKLIKRDTENQLLLVFTKKNPSTIRNLITHYTYHFPRYMRVAPN